MTVEPITECTTMETWYIEECHLTDKEPPQPRKKIPQIKTIFFKNEDGFDDLVNSWLKENGSNIELVDIKYSFSDYYNRNHAMIIYNIYI